MPSVSLTIFMDFLLSTGSRRLKRVRDWVNNPDYERAFDYWAPLRDWVVDAERGRLSGADLKSRVRTANARKQTRYAESLKGYLKFAKKPIGPCIAAPRGIWTYDDLSIKVNPELAYQVRGEKICVKLYFKSERVSNDKAAVIGSVMRSTLPGFQPRILDVKSGRLIAPSIIDDLDLLLKAEARSFAEIWRGMHAGWIPADLRKQQPVVGITTEPYEARGSARSDKVAKR
jgi:hypothetical protein